jgi:DNA polymerase-1
MATANPFSASADAAPETDQDELFLVDGSGYIFRAYFALPQNLTNPEGVPVGAVLGFSNMMHKLLADLHAPYIAVIFDAPGDTFRNGLYDQYKANRDAPPAELIPQFGLIREATEAFGIPAIEMEGYEADDLIATYARLASEQGKKVTIVGSDKDLMQLVGGNVRLYDPIKSKYIGIPEVEEKFGVHPSKVIDVQALAGDSVDNIPGVPGIGVKTAAQLITEFGSLEALLERTHEIKQPKRKEALTLHADNARLSKKLVTLDAHVEVPLGLADLRARDLARPQLKAFLHKHGFRTLAARLEQTANVAETIGRVPLPRNEARPHALAEAIPEIPHARHNDYTLITDAAVLKQWIAHAYDTGVLAVDTETTSLNPTRAKLVGISISPEIGKAAYIPVGHVNAPSDLFSSSPRPPAGGGTEGGGIPSSFAQNPNIPPPLTPPPAAQAGENLKQMPLADAIALLKPVLEDPSILKIGHNIKYDLQILQKHGITVSPVDDTMLLSYVLHGSTHGHGMDELVEKYCDHCTIKYEDVTGKGKNQITFDRVPLDQALTYAAEDAECTLRMHHAFKRRLPLEQVTRVYEDIERPIIPVLAQMERTGVRVDVDVLKAMSHDFGIKIVELEARIYGLAGHPFNVGSPKQLGQVLFDEMSIPGGKKTKTGDWSTAADILEGMGSAGHEIVDRVLEYRMLSKLKSTYTDALQTQINPETGRVHTSYQMAGTSTGRLSSTDPNLQNIPIRTEEGRKIRTAFVAEPGWTMLSVDYSQVELRLAAEMAGVEALKQAFRDKVDIHTLTASQVFGVPILEVTSDIRRAAKAVNFGIIYGISGWGLSKQLGIPQGDANAYIRKYLARFSEIQAFMEAAKAEARQHGYVKTLYGRKCFIANINNKMPGLRSGAERQAINAPLQGTAADIMKLAMGRMPAALQKANLRARMLLQVHDELLFEVPEEEIDETAALVKSVMEGVAALSVPLEADAGHGPNWGAAH